ncbi:MAG: hypothetical protein HC831_18725 [Chloroflexia bacterium]|nr:hypothetical protein [Chloroflexia bacterium]
MFAGAYCLKSQITYLAASPGQVDDYPLYFLISPLLQSNKKYIFRVKVRVEGLFPTAGDAVTFGIYRTGGIVTDLSRISKSIQQAKDNWVEISLQFETGVLNGAQIRMRIDHAITTAGLISGGIMYIDHAELYEYIETGGLSGGGGLYFSKNPVPVELPYFPFWHSEFPLRSGSESEKSAGYFR